MKLKNYLTNNSKKHIIFDFDGVIFQLNWYTNSLIDYKNKIWNAVAQIDGNLIDMVDDDIMANYKLSDLAIKRYGQKAKDIIFKIYKEKESTLIDTAKPLLDTINFIKENKDKYTYHIWSNNMTNTLIEVLKSKNLVKYFETIIGRDQVDFAKPDIGGFNKIFDPKIHDKSDFIMVGDFKSDEISAINAGIDFVYYP